MIFLSFDWMVQNEKARPVFPQSGLFMFGTGRGAYFGGAFSLK